MGIDPSLTATGLASSSTDGARRAGRVGRKGVLALPLHDRIVAILLLADQIEEWIVASGPALAVMEAPDVSHGYGGLVERIELGWEIMRRLRALEVPLVLVPSAILKAYATGKGGGPTTSKRHIVAAVATYWPEYATRDNNECDAAVLAEIGMDWLTGHRRVSDERSADWLNRGSIQWPSKIEQVF